MFYNNVVVFEPVIRNWANAEHNNIIITMSRSTEEVIHTDLLYQQLSARKLDFNILYYIRIKKKSHSLYVYMCVYIYIYNIHA